MNLLKVNFPLYKLRSYLEIQKNPYGLVKITTIKGTYIIDDTSIKGSFSERRMALASIYPTSNIYKLKEQVIYLRQLVKYKSGSVFIDYEGNIVKYQKGDKLFSIRSEKIERKKNYNNWTILYINNMEIPFLVGEMVKPTTTHVSIMDTQWGPFLYDLTNKTHEPYRRKI